MNLTRVIITIINNDNKNSHDSLAGDVVLPRDIKIRSQKSRYNGLLPQSSRVVSRHLPGKNRQLFSEISDDAMRCFSRIECKEHKPFTDELISYYTDTTMPYNQMVSENIWQSIYYFRFDSIIAETRRCVSKQHESCCFAEICY